MAADQPGLKRSIGLLGLTFYGVGDILGAGIYGLVGKAAGEMGAAIWLAFLVSMIAAGLTGLSYASLGSRYPRAGGAAYVTFRASGSGFLSYLVGLAILASGLTSMATAARVFAGYLSAFLPALPVLAAALGFALLLAGIVFWGIRESLLANIICTVIELSGLLLILAVGLPYLGSVDYLDATTRSNPSGELGLSLVLTGAVLTFYSFVGFEDILNIAEEVKDPQRTLPRGLLLAVLIASLIYIGISLVAVSVIPPQTLAQSHQPLVDVVREAAPWFPVRLFGVIALFAVANTALLNFVMSSRLLYGMSNQGLVPGALAQVHRRRRTPHVAILAVLGLFMILIVSGDIAALARSTSVLLLLCFTVVNTALLVLQRRERIDGAFEVPTAVPLLGALVCVVMLTQAKAQELLIAGALLVGITALYWLMRPQPQAIEQMRED